MSAQVSESVSGCGQEPATGCGQDSQDPAGHGCGQDPAEAARADRTRRLDAVEMAAWRAFVTTSTMVTTRLNQELMTAEGISMHEYEILVRLSEAPERRLRMSVLAETMAHSRSRLTHTVGRLEKEGYVLRAACADDKRGVHCELTEEGLAFLRRAAPVHLEGVRRHVIDRLSRDQLVALSSIMSALGTSDAGA
ncbi:MAG: MarR family transcriptional regulator [Actinomyces sp.]|uniref:MarR family winged helix-turn-helix transcriptional regulator n=1 Tax=Actinomyces sp. TaxID=29317 RepID=UPI0026DAD8F4|nr:MarR family transcriptional regulator [Actinomyces sp.]MDO4242194.1 MarR family transcriptional regulator [Actinomyces sp.]